MLLSESYLAHPIGEYLRAHHVGEIQPEWTIPGLGTGRPGRPKQLDYALLNRKGTAIQAAIEAKWVRDTATEKQYIVDDLLRLERIRDDVTGQGVFRYFLVAGRSAHFGPKFLRLRAQIGGHWQQFLPSLLASGSSADVKIDVFSSTGRYRELFRKFSTGYQVKLPKTFSTRLVALLQGGTVTVGVWRILSSNNRTEFDIAASTP
ncbi:MAG: hypothetical protein ABIE42_10735 [Candidatus Eisenbacteria bacterium]